MTAAPTDTTIRRVIVLSRQPSAIQRVTQAIHARAALQPLDTNLIVRVLDGRGIELAGVDVQWTLANAGDGAALRVINAVTDSLGLSRAEFTPGRSADAQSALADVKDVGRIDFAVTIPARSIRVEPERLTLWAGDDATVVAELRDANGVLLSGGTPSWAVSDTTVARVASGSSGRVTGVRGGTTELFAFTDAGQVRGSARLTVRPVTTGRFITAGGDSLPALRLSVSADGRSDSIPVIAGSFSARIPFRAGAAVDVRASPANDASFHDVAIRVDDQRDLQGLAIALVPTRYRIDAGSYEGQVMPIDARTAMQRVGRSAPFWRLVPYSGTGPRKLLGWRDADFPLRIAFNRARSNERIAPEDSAAFWAAARRMEADIGRRLFAPADMPADTTRADVIRVEITSQTPEGHTFVSWAQSGDPLDGVLLFRRAATLRSASVVTHELAHLLGFGHSVSWPTIAEPSSGAHARLTPQDVAYIQLAYRLRALQERQGARPGLPVMQ